MTNPAASAPTQIPEFVRDTLGGMIRLGEISGFLADTASPGAQDLLKLDPELYTPELLRAAAAHMLQRAENFPTDKEDIFLDDDAAEEEEHQIAYLLTSLALCLPYADTDVQQGALKLALSSYSDFSYLSYLRENEDYAPGQPLSGFPELAAVLMTFPGISAADKAALNNKIFVPALREQQAELNACIAAKDEESPLFYGVSPDFLPWLLTHHAHTSAQNRAEVLQLALSYLKLSVTNNLEDVPSIYIYGDQYPDGVYTELLRGVFGVKDGTTDINWANPDQDIAQELSYSLHYILRGLRGCDAQGKDRDTYKSLVAYVAADNFAVLDEEIRTYDLSDLNLNNDLEEIGIILDALPPAEQRASATRLHTVLVADVIHDPATGQTAPRYGNLVELLKTKYLTNPEAGGTAYGGGGVPPATLRQYHGGRCM